MINFLAILALGFFLGMRHATDPDHVIAVTTIVTRERSLYQSTTIGILWGLGHTLTILLVGGAIILFGLVMPPRIGLAMDLSVGVMLVLLGIFNLAALWKSPQAIGSDRGEGAANHIGRHSHLGSAHFRTQAHDRPRQIQNEISSLKKAFYKTLGWVRPRLVLRPIVVGVVHGLAGSAAIALFILATIRNPLWATAYLLVFGMGTIVGMALITTAIAIPSAYGMQRCAWLNRYLIVSSGVLSVVFGLFLAYRPILTSGLFLSDFLRAPR